MCVRVWQSKIKALILGNMTFIQRVTFLIAFDAAEPPVLVSL